MNSLLKLSSLLLLSMGAFAAHAASQSVTVNYTLTIPTVCTLSGNGTSINKTLPHEGTAVNQSIDVKCNVPYSIKAQSANSKGVNQSAVISTANPTLNIPYNITLTGGPNAVNVNSGVPVTVAPSATTRTDSYTLSAKTPSAIAIEDYIAGIYTDAVMVEISY